MLACSLQNELADGLAAFEEAMGFGGLREREGSIDAELEPAFAETGEDITGVSRGPASDFCNVGSAQVC